MARVFVIVVGGGLVILACGMTYLGAFPPTPVSHQVEKVIPNTVLNAAPNTVATAIPRTALKAD